MVETKQLEAAWAIVVASFATWFCELHKPRFVRMQRQAVPLESLRQHVRHTPRVCLMREGDHEVVRVTDEKCAALQTRFHIPLEPLIEHLMQVHIREQGRDHTSLWRAFFRMRDRTVFKHASLQPFVDGTANNTVRDPLIEEAAQRAVIERVEEASDVHFEHPATAIRHGALPQRLQRIVRAASRSKAIRARVKILFVDGFEQHRDRPLKHFVFEGRHTDRTRASVAFRDVYASNGRCSV